MFDARFVVRAAPGLAEAVGWRNDHPDFTQELPRKLLPTSAKETQRRRREKCQLTRRCLGRLGSSLDLKRACTISTHEALCV
jgi:hypothetical protein